MPPTVFLSLSGVDAKFVASVHDNLPDGLGYFYPKSFENGERLLDAMEDRIDEAQVFVLFASKASIQSCWVKFEIDRARLANIKRPSLKCLVFPIDANVTHESLPDWMREYWVGAVGQTARDIARYIRGVLTKIAQTSELAIAPLGRGALVDRARREFHATTFTNKVAPNVFIFAGHAGIGRRTIQRLFLPSIYPAMPNITFGPEFEMPPFADLTDIYRAVRRELEDHFSLAGFEADLAEFNAAPLDEQVNEVLQSMTHFSDLGQAVTFIVGHGLHEDRGELKPWVSALLSSASQNMKLKLCLISNRQLRSRDIREHANAMQVSVEHLDDADIRTLILATVPIFGGEPQLPSDTVVQSIGGHPTVARSVARLVATRGALVVEGDPRQLYDIQEKVLAESLSFDGLTPIERDILSMLSWVPQLNGHMLSDVILAQHDVRPQQLSEIIEYLMAGCLMQISGPNYLISAPIRGMFRRKHGYGSIELRKVFATYLREAWARAVSDDQLRTELFDAFVYMTALEGGSLPKEFSGLLLASTLQDLVREQYDRRHIDDEALNRVVAWGAPATQMRIDEDTREEILSYVLRAQVRLQSFGPAGDLLAFMKRRSYRSTAYLEAFMIRLSGGDLTAAVRLLQDARAIKKYMNSVIADLAICLKLLGRWSDLEKLINEEGRRVEHNAVLLDIKIGMLVASGDFGEAEKQIAKLRAMPFDDGRADSRTATILMNRDRDFTNAQRLLTAVLARQTRGAHGVRRLRALAAARGGDFEQARRDSDYLRNRPGGSDTFHRIEAEIKLVQRDYSGSETEREKVRSETVQDRLLHARILEAQGLDMQTPLHLRNSLIKQAASIRSSNRAVDEYDVDG